VRCGLWVERVVRPIFPAAARVPGQALKPGVGSRHVTRPLDILPEVRTVRRQLSFPCRTWTAWGRRAGRRGLLSIGVYGAETRFGLLSREADGLPS